ncbi:MAG: ubiquitin carboxyl-terminal hydrolase [Verrucomicrobia bacterium]|nr:ubiquitin carboxyl-terminal hydrolase [Verrucomicrobiota bacterium]
MAMETGPVTATTPITTEVIPQVQELSSTDWKVYAKVVLSYLLIGIGLALACSSFYIAFAISPMIAAASPITPIAMGVLLRNSTQQQPKAPIQKSLKAKTLDDMPPIGIRNLRANCWLNASLQLLFNVMAFETVVHKLDRPEFALIKKAYETYKQGGQVDSQEIRVLISQLFPEINPDARVPDDPVQFLDPFLRMSGYKPLEEYTHQIFRKESESVSVRKLSENKPTYLDLTYYFSGEKGSLTDILNGYFNKSEDNPLSEESKEIVIHSFKETPEDLTITIQSCNWENYSRKKKLEIKDSMEISIFPENIGQEARYLCDGFICHSGNTPNDGHYIAYVNKNGQWWELNDSLAHPLSVEKAHHLLETAFLRHYQRIPTELQS